MKKVEYNGEEVRFLPPIKRYVNAVERRLNLPIQVKARVMSDFSTSICARREQGESNEKIMRSLGTPAQAAAELNEQMSDYTYYKSPWRFVFLALAIIDILCAVAGIMVPYLFMKGAPSVIGAADGPAGIVVTSTWSVDAIWVAVIFAAVVLAMVCFYCFYRLGRCQHRNK